MVAGSLITGIRRAANKNIRAAWLYGGEEYDGAGSPGEAFLFFVYHHCEGWRYGFWRAPRLALPLFGSNIEGALKAFLAAPATNYNMALLACRFGTKLVDADGTGQCLSQKAADLWLAGAPAPDLGRAARLFWEMKRIRSDCGRWAEQEPCDPQNRARRNASMHAVLERALIGFCRAKYLWSLPASEFYRAAQDGRYAYVAARVGEFLATDDPLIKARATCAVAEDAMQALAPGPERDDDPAPETPTWYVGPAGAAPAGSR